MGHAVDERRRVGRHRTRVAPVGPPQPADGRAVRVHVHVHHRREVQVHANVGQFTPHGHGAQPGFARRALPHLARRRILGKAALRLQPLHPPAFLVHGHEQRQPGGGCPGGGLQRGGQRAHLFGGDDVALRAAGGHVAVEQDDTAHAPGTDVVQHLVHAVAGPFSGGPGGPGGPGGSGGTGGTGPGGVVLGAGLVQQRAHAQHVACGRGHGLRLRAAKPHHEHLADHVGKRGGRRARWRSRAGGGLRLGPLGGCGRRPFGHRGTGDAGHCRAFGRGHHGGRDGRGRRSLGRSHRGVGRCGQGRWRTQHASKAVGHPSAARQHGASQREGSDKQRQAGAPDELHPPRAPANILFHAPSPPSGQGLHPHTFRPPSSPMMPGRTWHFTRMLRPTVP